MPDLLTVITKCLPFLESSMFIKYFKKKPEVIQNIAESDYTYMWILDVYRQYMLYYIIYYILYMYHV